MRPEAPEVGLALSAVLLLVRMGLVVLVLLGFRAVAPVGFVPFALCMAGGFLVGYTVELLRYAKLLPTRTALRGHVR
jgi:fructose-specific phosphotransferase system IIC component